MCLNFIFLKRCSKNINLYFKPIFSVVLYFIFTLKLLQNNKCAMIFKSSEIKAGIHLYQVICCFETILNAPDNIEPDLAPYVYTTFLLSFPRAAN